MIRFDIKMDDGVGLVKDEKMRSEQRKRTQQVLSPIQHEPVKVAQQGGFLDKLSNALSGRGFDLDEDVEKYERVARYYNREHHKNFYRGYEISIRDMRDHSDDGILIKTIDKVAIQDVKLVAKNPTYMMIGFTPNQEAWDTYLGCQPGVVTRSREGQISQHEEKDLDRVGIVQRRYGPKYHIISTFDSFSSSNELKQDDTTSKQEDGEDRSL